MTAEIHVRRLEPDTVHGEKLEATITYSSFDAKEIDELQENIPNVIWECEHEEDEEDAEDLPSVDAVEVVRCRECKYCRKEDESEYWCYGFCSPARLVRKDDFCSYGCKCEGGGEK